MRPELEKSRGTSVFTGCIGDEKDTVHRNLKYTS
jgi:hypothetical protein